MNRMFGAILLIAGTAIGAGMLAIPIVTAEAGFYPSLLLLIACWGLLFTTSLLLLDVTLHFKGEVNLITMAEKTLGTFGKVVCWICYLLLLYSLNAAYIAGLMPLFPWPLLLLLAVFVYFGTQVVDRINRLLMIGLAVSYLQLLPSDVKPEFLQHTNWGALTMAVPVIITSFGFHIIIPTLVTYLDHNKKQLKQALFIGSLMPLVVYIIWEYLVLGSVPKTEISVMAGSKAFSLFAITTSFLGVSLALSGFLADGLKSGREAACLLTFVPPLILIWYHDELFVTALKFAGIFVVILLCVLPACMAATLPSYKTPQKRLLLLSVLTLSLGALCLS